MYASLVLTLCALASYGVRQYIGGRSDILIHLDEVSCNGDENVLSECGHRGIGVFNCAISEGAAVICSGEPKSPPHVFSHNYRDVY